MKLIKTAEGKSQVKISKAEWEKIGNDNGWMQKEAAQDMGQVGTVSFLLFGPRDARQVGAEGGQLELDIGEMGTVVLDSKASPTIANVISALTEKYRAEAGDVITDVPEAPAPTGEMFTP